MMKQWLMRRAVRMPRLARHHGAHQFVGVQAALHQRLGAPARTELDRLLRLPLSWLCASLDDLESRDVITSARAAVADAGRRADQDRLRSKPSRAASTAPSSETSSQGWATAVTDRRSSRPGSRDQAFVLLMRAVLRCAQRRAQAWAAPCVGCSASSAEQALDLLADGVLRSGVQLTARRLRVPPHDIAARRCS